jgi:hypothetical protein
MGISQEAYGIKVKFKNGNEEFFDPIYKETEDILNTDSHLIIKHMGYTHEFLQSDIQSWEYYPICENCENDIENCICNVSREDIYNMEGDIF